MEQRLFEIVVTAAAQYTPPGPDWGGAGLKILGLALPFAGGIWAWLKSWNKKR